MLHLVFFTLWFATPAIVWFVARALPKPLHPASVFSISIVLGYVCLIAASVAQSRSVEDQSVQQQADRPTERTGDSIGFQEEGFDSAVAKIFAVIIGIPATVIWNTLILCPLYLPSWIRRKRMNDAEPLGIGSPN